MLLQAMKPNTTPIERFGVDPTAFGQPEQVKRTRKVVRNWELSVLEGWVMEHDYSDPKQKPAVFELARRLGRTEGGVRNLVRRYLAGVYSVSSAKDDDPAKYDVTLDPSRGAKS